MFKITFRTERAACCYASMAEGMAEVREDCEDSETADSLYEICARASAVIDRNRVYPLAVSVPDCFIETARDVLENCLDNTIGAEPETGEESDDIYPGDVTIEESAI